MRGLTKLACAAWLAAAAAPGCHDAAPGLSPKIGSIRGGDNVRIEGRGFLGHGPPLVHFGLTVGKGVVVEGDGLIRVTTPEMDEPGTVTVTVSFPDGERVELAESFSFEEREAFIELRPKSER